MAQAGLIQIGVWESPTTTGVMRLLCIYTVQGQDSGMTRLQKAPSPDLSVHITSNLLKRIKLYLFKAWAFCLFRLLSF